MSKISSWCKRIGLVWHNHICILKQLIPTEWAGGEHCRSLGDQLSMFRLAPTGCPSPIDEVTVWFPRMGGIGERSAGPPSWVQQSWSRGLYFSSHFVWHSYVKKLFLLFPKLSYLITGKTKFWVSRREIMQVYECYGKMPGSLLLTFPWFP